jgi:hypothetical protein
MNDGRISAYIDSPASLEAPGAVYDPTFKSLAQAVLPAEPV